MYGLDTEIKKYIDKKIEKNKTFLKNLTFYNEDYKLVSMFDSDLNANLSPQRYFAEVANRVNTLFRVSKELDLVPAFLTITCPAEFHPTSKNFNGSTPKQSALYLSDIWRRFLNLMVFRNIKKNVGHNMIYIRVYEPHKSGTPHLHAMIFVPKSYLKEVKKKFFEHYTKYNFKKVGLKFIANFSHARYEDTKGAIAYILKYMNKTFKSSKDDKMTNEAYYFAYHGIRRFITSQTLIPLWIYRRVKHNEDTRDLYKLTKQYKQGHIYTTFDKEYIMQRYIKKDKIVYDPLDVEIVSSVEEKVIYQKNHFISEQFKTSAKYYDNVPSRWIKQDKQVPIYVDGVLTSFFYKGNYIPYKKHITQLNDFELIELHNTYDVDSGSYIRYLSIKNLMISRGLLPGVKYDLNNFKFSEFLL